MRVPVALALSFALSLAAAFSAASAHAQEMTARELFYSAVTPGGSTSPVPTKAKAPAKKPVAQVTAQPQPQTPPALHTTPDGTGLIIPVRATAPPPASGSPLGLKYTIMKLEGSTMTPVGPSTVFHAGDKIQFSIESNGPGYLYIINKGSSGKWKPMFPATEIAGGDNHIAGFQDYTFPSGYRYVFDEKAGVENLFIIFSRDPKPDFEQMVYSLSGAKTTPASQPKEPAPAPAAGRKVLVASNIEDSTVTRFRETYARDLVIEKVGDEPKAKEKEKAVFVVNASGASDSCVVADLRLVHQ